MLAPPLIGMKPEGVGIIIVLVVVLSSVIVDVEVTVDCTVDVAGVMVTVGVLVIFCVAVKVTVRAYVVLPTLAFELGPSLVVQVWKVCVVSARTKGSTPTIR